jgi:hypothetical protein
MDNVQALWFCRFTQFAGDGGAFEAACCDDPIYSPASSGERHPNVRKRADSLSTWTIGFSRGMELAPFSSLSGPASPGLDDVRVGSTRSYTAPVSNGTSFLLHARTGRFWLCSSNLAVGPVAGAGNSRIPAETKHLPTTAVPEVSRKSPERLTAEVLICTWRALPSSS